MEAELQSVVQRTRERLASRVQDTVSWDVNLRNREERFAPFIFEMQVLGERNGPLQLQIEASRGALQEPDDPRMGTGGVVWSGGIGLARYLEQQYGTAGMAGRRVLELGCGTGLVSLVAAALGAVVTATDIASVLSSVTVANLEAHSWLSGSVTPLELVWGSTALEPLFGRESGWWDLVVGADVLYHAQHAPLLLATLQGVVGPGCKALVAVDRRGREGVKAFLHACAGCFAVREVDNAQEMPVGYRFVHVGLYELTRRNEGERRREASEACACAGHSVAS